MHHSRTMVTAAATSIALLMLCSFSGCGWATAPDADTIPATTAPHNAATPHISTFTLSGVDLQITSLQPVTIQRTNRTPIVQTVIFALTSEDSAHMVLTSPGELEVQADGSISILQHDGTPIAAISPPSMTDDVQNPPALTVTATDATHAQIAVSDSMATPRDTGTAVDPSSTTSLRATFTIGTDALEGASWGENEGGRSLSVDPADWSRHAGLAGLDVIRSQLVALVPQAGSTSMGNQLVCHAMGSPYKAIWNLEPWRPDVGLVRTAAAACNP